MPRKTKSEIFACIATGYHQIKNGETPHKVGAADGSVVTRPTVPCPDLPEAIVLEQCLNWLKRHKIWARRMNVGKGSIGNSGFHTYGIIGSADITGLLPDGRRLEIECKAGRGGRLSVDQQKFGQDIRDNNGFCFVVHGIPELEFYFKGLICGCERG
jgi:hypothetical protein